jgi:predicted lipid carrier protein YhbT
MVYQSTQVPARLAGLMMRPLPKAVLEPMIGVAMRVLAKRHGDVFDRLASLDPASVLIAPDDLPHSFLLQIGAGGPAVSVASEIDIELADARIKGPLPALLDLLEGRTDGDKLFFSRTLTITGNTEAVVAIRNAVDGGEISLMADILSLFGPLASPAEKLISGLDELAQKAIANVSELKRSFGANRELIDECAKLREEMTELKTRLARVERRREKVAS